MAEKAKKAGKTKKMEKRPAARPRVTPIPLGFHTVTPHLVIDGAAHALAFYERAFGAKVKVRHPAPDGKRLMHATMRIGDSVVMLADDFPEWRGGKKRSPKALGDSPVTLHLYVRNADFAFDRAVKAGCTVEMPIMDAFWGDRYGQVKDPYGHLWSIATRCAIPTRKQVEAAAKQAMAQ